MTLRQNGLLVESLCKGVAEVFIIVIFVYRKWDRSLIWWLLDCEIASFIFVTDIYGFV